MVRVWRLCIGVLKISNQSELNGDIKIDRTYKTFYETQPKHFRGVYKRFKKTKELNEKRHSESVILVRDNLDSKSLQ